MPSIGKSTGSSEVWMSTEISGWRSAKRDNLGISQRTAKPGALLSVSRPRERRPGNRAVASAIALMAVPIADA